MIFIHPNDLAEKWPEIRFGLMSILLKTGEKWIPEDIYHALKAGEALLFARDGTFVVVKADGEALFIWCAYNAIQGGFKSGIEWLKDHARQNGFKRITHTSPRTGWARLFKAVSINYEMEL